MGDPVGLAGPWSSWYQTLSHAEAAGWQGWVTGQQAVEPWERAGLMLAHLWVELGPSRPGGGLQTPVSEARSWVCVVPLVDRSGFWDLAAGPRGPRAGIELLWGGTFS